MYEIDFSYFWEKFQPIWADGDDKIVHPALLPWFFSKVSEQIQVLGSYRRK
jgi:hypothetical protein